ncbi:hypothetical protein [Spirillospora sp. CA-294931]|uniref:bestrophin-like domain n=1 Tax=Spirillospora sp. CA-294931 TaxID=3240042 RepID=UPI003D94D1A8
MLAYLLAAAAAIALVAVASLTVRQVRRARDDDDPDGPTTSHTGAMISALFLLAFAVAIVVPWTTTDTARLNTYTETRAIVEAHWAAGRLPSPVRERVQTGLRDYAAFVRDTEWPLMADGKLSPAGWIRLDGLRREGLAVRPGDDEELKDARTAFLDHVAEISAARHQRAMDAKTTPPPGLLIITVLTGLAVVLLPFLAGARPRGMILVPLGIMAGLLGIGVYLAVDIAHAFAGGLAVKPDAFTDVLAEIQRISAGG